MDYISLLLLLLVWPGDTKDITKDAEVVYPERIHSHRWKRDLSTELKDKQHEDSLTVLLKTKQEGDLVLDLKKHETYPGKMLLRTYADDGTPLHKQMDRQDSFYIGPIKGKTNSDATISTFKGGIIGSLSTGVNKYEIQPVNKDGGHMFRRVDDEMEDKLTVSGLAEDNMMESPNDNMESRDANAFPPGEIVTQVDSEASKSLKVFAVRNAWPEYVPYMTEYMKSHIRYVEMFISVGYALYKEFNGTDVAIAHVLNVAAHVDKRYNGINVRVVIVALEIQNKGHSFTRGNNSDPTERSYEDLRNFRAHVRKLIKEDAFKNIQIDDGQFFSSKHAGWRGTGGRGYLNDLCKPIPGIGICTWRSHNWNVMVLSHEFGHNFGFWHSTSECKCLVPNGCFMSGSQGPGRGIADCNMKHIENIRYPCLDNHPTNTLYSKCGNGILESGEECDCGTAENCEKVDPCCEPHGCKLKAEVRCSYLNNPDCCDNTCQFARQGKLCREAASSCDVAEYCSGENATCPTDRSAADGTHCGESKKLILGTDRNKVVLKELTPSVTGRYFKLVPKKWTKNKQACMKLEMYGCDPSHVRSEVNCGNDKASTCSKCNGEASCNGDCEWCNGACHLKDTVCLAFAYVSNKNTKCFNTCKRTGTCPETCGRGGFCCRQGFEGCDQRMEEAAPKDSHRCMKFWYGKVAAYVTDKTCRKECKTGICPEVCGNRGYCCKKGRKGCDKQLQDVAPANDHLCVNYEYTNAFCATGVGLEYGSLPDSALSAGPTDSSYSVEKIRMNKQGWCAKSSQDGSWVQVDFGKIVNVQHILIQGLENNWVYAYHLMYSDNGNVWSYYKESSDVNTEGLNSACFRGVCAPTHDHQCQLLWDPRATSSPDECWNELNTNTEGYGTCNPTKIVPCDKGNIMCGQLQCTSSKGKPYWEVFRNFKSVNIEGNTCNAVKLVSDDHDDEVGVGMVEDGTKCGDGKICINQECKTAADHGKLTCGTAKGKICGGNGYCMDNGDCSCNGGYDPVTYCATKIAAVDGGWSDWSKWTTCTKTCDVGKRRRHRFCNNPTAKYYGKACVGDRVEEEPCNTKACPARCEEVNVNLEGNNIVDWQVYLFNNWHECSAYCRSIPACTWWSYKITGDRTCYVKTSDSGRNTTENFVSGSRSCGAGAYAPDRSINCWDGCNRQTGSCPSVCGSGGYCCRRGVEGCNTAMEAAAPLSHPTCIKYLEGPCEEVNVEFAGNDINGAEVDNIPSWEKCSEYCRTWPRCTWWTYKSTGHCYVKTSNKGRRVVAGDVSGPRSCGKPALTYKVDVKCWSVCKTGFCPLVCGTNGYCCRKHYTGCNRLMYSVVSRHRCVKYIPDFKRWREDLRCGAKYKLSNGDISECDPNGKNPCCSDDGWCGSTPTHCECAKCKDYHLLSAVVFISANASSVKENNYGNWGPNLAWTGESTKFYGFFRSEKEKDPWLEIQLRPVSLTGLTIQTQKTCCGDQLKNLEIRGGMSPGPKNEVIGEFKGPAKTGKAYKIPFHKTVKVQYIRFQIIGKGILMINGIKVDVAKESTKSDKKEDTLDKTYLARQFEEIEDELDTLVNIL